MSIKREWLEKFRYTPVKIKTGWFSSRTVLAIQQQYHDTGEYDSPDVSGQYCPINIDRKGWEFVSSIAAPNIRGDS